MRCKSAIATIAAAAMMTALPLRADEQQDSQRPYRETRLTYRHTASALSFVRDAELTYNPYYAMTLQMEVMWWFNDALFAKAAADLTRELTRADDTTYKGEITMSDTVLNFGAQDFWKIPRVEIGLSADAEITLPTSKASAGDTMVLGMGANIGIDREFDVLEGLTISCTMTPTRYFHRYTTSEFATPLIADCANSPGGCARFLTTGTRNIAWSLALDVTADFALTGWAALSASVGTITGFLHRSAASPEALSYAGGPPVNERYLNYYEVMAIFSPIEALDVIFGTDTLNPQLSPDSTYYPPLLNRYTYVFLSLRLDIARLMEQMHRP